MSSNVWPEGGVSPSFVKDLERLFPQVIVLFNEFYRAWQAYELPKGSDWNADRLRNAILASHAMESAPEWEWWEHPLAPRIFEELLPQRPGDWFIQYLREADHWRTGGAQRFLSEVDSRKREREEKAKAERHEYHLERADEMRRPALDSLPTGASRTDAMKQIRKNEGRAEIMG